MKYFIPKKGSVARKLLTKKIRSSTPTYKSDKFRLFSNTTTTVFSNPGDYKEPSQSADEITQFRDNCIRFNEKVMEDMYNVRDTSKYNLEYNSDSIEPHNNINPESADDKECEPEEQD